MSDRSRALLFVRLLLGLIFFMAGIWKVFDPGRGRVVLSQQLGQEAIVFGSDRFPRKAVARVLCALSGQR